MQGYEGAASARARRPENRRAPPPPPCMARRTARRRPRRRSATLRLVSPAKKNRARPSAKKAAAGAPPRSPRCRLAGQGMPCMSVASNAATGSRGAQGFAEQKQDAHGCRHAGLPKAPSPFGAARARRVERRPRHGMLVRAAPKGEGPPAVPPWLGEPAHAGSVERRGGRRRGGVRRDAHARHAREPQPGRHRGRTLALRRRRRRRRAPLCVAVLAGEGGGGWGYGQPASAERGGAPMHGMGAEHGGQGAALALPHDRALRVHEPGGSPGARGAETGAPPPARCPR